MIRDLVLSLADSNLAYPARIAFLGLHGTGVVLGLAYSSKTPDLYPGGSHSKFGWILTGVALLDVTCGLLAGCLRSRAAGLGSIKGDDHEDTPFIPFSDSRARVQQDGEANSSVTSFRDFDDRRDSSGTDSDTLYDVPNWQNRTTSARRYSRRVKWFKSWSLGLDSTRVLQMLEMISAATHVVLVVLAFLCICTGIVTMAGIFVSCCADSCRRSIC
jgi:hypothetical protein